ncbi:MAG: class I SAM-dependent methyltransferase [Bryobacterales bacterium]|nr:class I SAM-dependent methyltransferase [Bryobacterales bacterium]
MKRAEVEFNTFASLGEPERAIPDYEQDNAKRGAILRQYLDFVGPLSPFLEIGANAGHTSYLLANSFHADGFALDISAGALRHGAFLRDHWGLTRSPVRVAGDALNLPFRDGSLRFVMAFQVLSQFMDMDAVFREVHRVLMPGGVFFFGDEPIRRRLTLGLFRSPYYESMKPWERKLHDRGLLGFLVKDVIGAHQEESVGIRQNHRMCLRDWENLVDRHFVARRFLIQYPQRGWMEEKAAAVGRRMNSDANAGAAGLLGGTLSAFCRKAGATPQTSADPEQFERLLRCPDCHEQLVRGTSDGVACAACSYSAPNEDGVYTLIRSSERGELYPGNRADIVDCGLPGHEEKLREGWHELEGVFANKYRWIAERAVVLLKRVRPGPQKLRVRGFVPEQAFQSGDPVSVHAVVNGLAAGHWLIDRPGLFVLETIVPDAAEYRVEISALPRWTVPEDDRVFSINLSLVRLVEASS